MCGVGKCFGKMLGFEIVVFMVVLDLMEGFCLWLKSYGIDIMEEGSVFVVFDFWNMLICFILGV